MFSKLTYMLFKLLSTGFKCFRVFIFKPLLILRPLLALLFLTLFMKNKNT